MRCSSREKVPISGTKQQVSNHRELVGEEIPPVFLLLFPQTHTPAMNLGSQYSNHMK
jgi:hypothetical protein